MSYNKVRLGHLCCAEFYSPVMSGLLEDMAGMAKKLEQAHRSLLIGAMVEEQQDEEGGFSYFGRLLYEFMFDQWAEPEEAVALLMDKLDPTLANTVDVGALFRGMEKAGIGFSEEELEF